MIRSFAFTLVFLILASTIVYGQEYELKTSSEIYQDLKKLEKGMRVLYVAAHLMMRIPVSLLGWRMINTLKRPTCP